MASLRRLVGFLVLVLVALVVAHNLVFLLTYGAGYDEALAQTGHDGSWATAVVVVIAAGIGFFVLAAWRLYRLGVIARALAPATSHRSPSASGFGRRIVGLWWRLFATTTILFVIQENLEHQRIGEALPGLWVLGSGQYSDATVVIAVVTLAVAIVAALFRWQLDVLVARIASALKSRHQRPEDVLPRPDATRDGRPESFVGRGLAVRAPPSLAP